MPVTLRNSSLLRRSLGIVYTNYNCEGILAICLVQQRRLRRGLLLSLEQQVA
jgi:hypothetical protein